MTKSKAIKAMDVKLTLKKYFGLSIGELTKENIEEIKSALREVAVKDIPPLQTGSKGLVYDLIDTQSSGLLRYFVSNYSFKMFGFSLLAPSIYEYFLFSTLKDGIVNKMSKQQSEIAFMLLKANPNYTRHFIEQEIGANLATVLMQYRAGKGVFNLDRALDKALGGLTVSDLLNVRFENGECFDTLIVSRGLVAVVEWLVLNKPDYLAVKSQDILRKITDFNETLDRLHTIQGVTFCDDTNCTKHEYRKILAQIKELLTTLPSPVL